MKDAPDIYQIDNLQRHLKVFPTEREVEPDKWVHARPMRIGGLRRRFKAAYLVFTGEADALLWRGQ